MSDFYNKLANRFFLSFFAAGFAMLAIVFSLAERDIIKTIVKTSFPFSLFVKVVICGIIVLILGFLSSAFIIKVMKGEVIEMTDRLY